ncbi:nucleotidyltransferase family protein [Parapedomonas caeni]
MTLPLPVTALVPAGRRPGRDPLAEHFGVSFKAIIPVGGEPMVGRVVRALLATPGIGRVVLLTQEPELLMTHPDLTWLADDPRVGFRTSRESISASVLDAMAALDGDGSPLLLTTADHALLTPAMVASFLTPAVASGADLAVGFVEQATLLARYPLSRRTWLKFRGGWYSGANLFLFRDPGARAALELWREVEQDRKKVWKIFARFGPWLFLRMLTRSISLPAAFAAAGRRLGLTAIPVVMAEAEACIDVDKPDDHMLVEQILKDRAP